MAEFLKGIDKTMDYKMRLVKSEEAVKNNIHSKIEIESDIPSKPSHTTFI